MASPATAPKITKDRHTADGVRLFNPSKPHGTIYSDGFSEAKYVQEWEGAEVLYRGDGTPMGYTGARPGPSTEALEAENSTLQARVAALEARLAAMAPAAVSTKEAPPKQEAAPDGAAKRK